MFNIFFKNKEEELIKDIQKHNFDLFVNSLCNLKGKIFKISFNKILALKEEHNKCFNFLEENAFGKPIEELKIKENNCLKLQSDFESCDILHKQLVVIFKNRQKKFISDIKEQKTNFKF